MPTADDLAAQLARIDYATAALADVRTFLAGLTPDRPAEPAGPTAPLTPGRPTARASTVNPSTAIDVTWTVPHGSPRTLVSWGTPTGQTGQTFIPAPAAAVTLDGLAPGTAYVIDLLSAQPDGTFHPGARARLASATETTVAPASPPGPGGYPTDPKAWDAKRDWTIAAAGAPATGLTVVDSPASLTAAGLPGTWANGQWSLPAAGTYTGLDVRGLIWYTGQGPLTLLSGKSRGVQFSASSAKLPALFERWEFGPSPTGRQLGQGAVNFYGQPDWVIRRCVLHGFADGVQCSGTGLLEECVIRDLAYGPTTHNDWAQHYGGGTLTARRCVFDSAPPRPNAHNGIFSSNDPTGNYVLEDCDLRVSGPHAAQSNILHANTATITLVRCRARGGRLIRDVRSGPDSFVSPDPNA